MAYRRKRWYDYTYWYRSRNRQYSNYWRNQKRAKRSRYIKGVQYVGDRGRNFNQMRLTYLKGERTGNWREFGESIWDFYDQSQIGHLPGFTLSPTQMFTRNQMGHLTNVGMKGAEKAVQGFSHAIRMVASILTVQGMMSTAGNIAGHLKQN
jgi:hypothetical protein